MKQSTLFAVTFFLVLCYLISSTAGKVKNEVYYITPTQLSPQNISPCDQFLNRYHNDSFFCSVTTLDNFFYHPTKSRNCSDINSLVIFLPGTHVTNRSASIERKCYIFNESIFGIGKVAVHVISTGYIYLSFSNSKYKKISNIHFMNYYCCESPRLVSILRFRLDAVYTHIISLENIQITGSNATDGITISIVRNKNRDGSVQIINITNSIIEGNGLSYTNEAVVTKKKKETFDMTMDNVTFYNSCLSLYSTSSKKKHFSIKIKLTRFIRCSCTPVLSFTAINNVTLDSITVSECRSKHKIMLYSIFSTLNIHGHCSFFNNTGAFFIIHQKQIISNATVRFSNNFIQGFSSIFSAQNSEVIFNGSYLIFENNYGQLCGGIFAINAQLLFQHDTTITFTGNQGKISGGILLFLNSELKFIKSGTSEKGRSNFHFTFNNGSAIISNNSKIKFQESNVEFIHNSLGGNEVLSVVLVTNKSSLVFKKSIITFKNNSGGQCGGIMAKNMTELVFENSEANFLDNSGWNGGAVSLHSKSILRITGTASQVMFSNNRAQKGGAIFVNDNTYIHDHHLIKSPFQLVSSSVCLHFTENSAVIGGSDIYGGWIDWSVDKYENMTYNPGISH